MADVIVRVVGFERKENSSSHVHDVLEDEDEQDEEDEEDEEDEVLEKASTGVATLSIADDTRDGVNRPHSALRSTAMLLGLRTNLAGSCFSCVPTLTAQWP